MSRQSRSRSLRHRPNRAIPALIVAVVLLALAVFLVWTSIVKLINGSWPAFLAGPTDWLASLTWGAPGMWVISIGVLLLGLVLLFIALKPGKHNGMRVSGDNDDRQSDSEVLMSQRAITRLATSHAERMDGVDSSKAKAKGKRLKLSVVTPLRNPQDLRDRVTDSVTERLRSAGLNPPPKITTRVRAKDA